MGMNKLEYTMRVGILTQPNCEMIREMIVNTVLLDMRSELDIPECSPVQDAQDIVLRLLKLYDAFADEKEPCLSQAEAENLFREKYLHIFEVETGKKTDEMNWPDAMPTCSLWRRKLIIRLAPLVAAHDAIVCEELRKLAEGKTNE